jgi:hypothetical protein
MQCSGVIFKDLDSSHKKETALQNEIGFKGTVIPICGLAIFD